MEGDDFVAQYEEWGEEEVRSKLALNIITGRGLLPAQDWLRRKDSERAIQDRASSLHAQEEQTALAKRAAASAEEAANSARLQAKAASDANDLAQKANVIATLALIAAMIAIAVSIVAAFTS